MQCFLLPTFLFQKKSTVFRERKSKSCRSRDNCEKNLQIEIGDRKIQPWFADLPLSHSIDLSRQGKRTLGAVKREIGLHLAWQGFSNMVTRLGGML